MSLNPDFINNYDPKEKLKAPLTLILTISNLLELKLAAIKSNYGLNIIEEVY